MHAFNKNTSTWVIVLLLFFFIDEIAFILYNISFFQFMCANTFSLFFTDEIPSYAILLTYGSATPALYEVLAADVPFFFYLDMLPNVCYNFDLFMYDGIECSSNGISLLYKESGYLFETYTTYYKIKLEATNVKKNISSFYPLQHYIYTIPGESSLIFYRLENKTDSSLQTLSVYVTIPSEAVAYIKKLQCFCYEELMVAPKSVIDLPILFSIDEEVLNEEFKEITINYILLLK